jgi:hypothetical protein
MWEESAVVGREKRKDTEGKKDNQTYQTLFEKEGGEGHGNIMERVNLFKVHCTHLWNYKNEISSNY